MKMERWREAEEQITQHIARLRRDGSSGVWLASAHLARGTCLLHLERHADAATALTDADKLFREHSPRHRSLQRTHSQLIKVFDAWGKPEEAAAWRDAAREWKAKLGGTAPSEASNVR